MSCLACKATVPPGARFCASCGAHLQPSEAETVLGSDQTKLASAPNPSSQPKATTSGWLTSSGSIDHGRFTPGVVLEERYRIIGLLGRGGMGEVYRADDLRLGQAVALKFLPPGLGRDAQRLAQFHTEVRTARQVSHPNICRVYDIGEAEGQLFLSMEFVDGEDLSASLRRFGRFPEDRAVEIARQICVGLAAAHERGVLHRDLKPANIMLDGQGRVRIMDFSLATAEAVTDVRAGTPAYMAPEQLLGREVTVRSDIFALGLVLYELFTGRRAFEAKTVNDLVSQHESGTIASPSEIMRSLDPMVERAIMRCLERDPAKRPGSALAVAASLPGGDPLAAAIAAGETPSPEMVAAAGGESATLSTGQSVVLGTAMVALLVLMAALADRGSIMGRVPLTKPRAVLIDRASELRRTFGYTGTGRRLRLGVLLRHAVSDLGCETTADGGQMEHARERAARGSGVLVPNQSGHARAVQPDGAGVDRRSSAAHTRLDENRSRSGRPAADLPRRPVLEDSVARDVRELGRAVQGGGARPIAVCGGRAGGAAARVCGRMEIVEGRVSGDARHQDSRRGGRVSGPPDDVRGPGKLGAGRRRRAAGAAGGRLAGDWRDPRRHRADRGRSRGQTESAAGPRRPARRVPDLGLCVRRRHRLVCDRAHARAESFRGRPHVRDRGRRPLLEQRPLRRLPGARAVRPPRLAGCADHVVAADHRPPSRSDGRPRSGRRHACRPCALVTGAAPHPSAARARISGASTVSDLSESADGGSKRHRHASRAPCRMRS